MRKIFFLLVLLFLGNFCFALEMNQIPAFSGMSESYQNYVYDTPPAIYKVMISPEEPTSNSPVEVTATVFNNPDKTDIETLEVILRYSIDGGENWYDVCMEQSDKKTWKATIPPQPKDTEVIFYISASDAATNLATEVPCMYSEWPPANEKRLAICAPDEDEGDSAVDENMNVLQEFAGYDEEYLYFKIYIKKKITKGTMSPPFLNAYFVGLLNLDKGDDILGGYLLTYMPYLKTLANYPECILYDLGQIQINYEADAEAKVEDNILYLKVKRKALGENIRGFKVVFGTVGALTLEVVSGASAEGRPTGLMKFMEESLKIFRARQSVTTKDIDVFRQYFYFGDLSPYTNIYLRNHYYKVVQ